MDCAQTLTSAAAALADETQHESHRRAAAIAPSSADGQSAAYPLGSAGAPPPIVSFTQPQPHAPALPVPVQPRMPSGVPSAPSWSEAAAAVPRNGETDFAVRPMLEPLEEVLSVRSATVGLRSRLTSPSASRHRMHCTECAAPLSGQGHTYYRQYYGVPQELKPTALKALNRNRVR